MARKTTAARKYLAQTVLYRVKRGDTLWSISESFFGDWKGWNRIFLANQDILNNSPDFLLPGTWLQVPQSVPDQDKPDEKEPQAQEKKYCVRILVKADSNPEKNEYTMEIYDGDGKLCASMKVGRNAEGSKKDQKAPNYGKNQETPPGTYHVNRAVRQPEKQDDAFGKPIQKEKCFGGKEVNFFGFADGKDAKDKEINGPQGKRTGCGMHAGREGAKPLHMTQGCIRLTKADFEKLFDCLCKCKLDGDVDITILDRFDEDNRKRQQKEFDDWLKKASK